jgi:hypothetical protein
MLRRPFSYRIRCSFPDGAYSNAADRVIRFPVIQYQVAPDMGPESKAAPCCEFLDSVKLHIWLVLGKNCI